MKTRMGAAMLFGMKRYVIMFAFLLPVVAALGWYGMMTSAQLETAAGAQKIPPTMARKMMNGPKEFVLLDVRTEEEFKERRINGALLIPHDEIHARAKDLPADKSKPIFVYCRLGRRSQVAGEKLAGLGYKNVYDMGGVVDWPYETIGG
ncbi:MAG: rhodanese-like domain-containing protein [Alphaproteobacteria bacterium]|nr:rhodanese-like domain-containing protein [Alphaproteobacteria bacterium]